MRDLDDVERENELRDQGYERLLTVAEVRERLSRTYGVALSTVYHWIASGQLPATRHGIRWGGTLRVRESDLDAFIQRRREATP